VGENKDGVHVNDSKGIQALHQLPFRRHHRKKLKNMKMFVPSEERQEAPLSPRDRTMRRVN